MNDQDKDKILKELFANPPTIGIVGLSGTGKSSTINAMFKTNLPISHTTGCTKTFDENNFVFSKKGPVENEKITLRVYDAPGLGESQLKDPEFLNQYKENLPKCDVILWVLSARNRALALDQKYLAELSPFSDRIIFGLSQVDLVEPRDWHPKMPIPSIEMQKNIEEILLNRQERLFEILGRKTIIIPYSNYRKYNLTTLFTAILENCPKGRKWIFQTLNGIDLEAEKNDFNELVDELGYEKEPVQTQLKGEQQEPPKPKKSTIFSLINRLLGRGDKDTEPEFKDIDEIRKAKNALLEQERNMINHK
jgi:uncharacterized protein